MNRGSDDGDNIELFNNNNINKEKFDLNKCKMRISYYAVNL